MLHPNFILPYLASTLSSLSTLIVSGAANTERKDAKARANNGYLKQTEKNNNLRSHYLAGRKMLRAWMLWWIFPDLSWIAFRHAVSNNVVSCRLAWLRWFCLMTSWSFRGTHSRTNSSQTTTQINTSLFVILCKLPCEGLTPRFFVAVVPPDEH